MIPFTVICQCKPLPEAIHKIPCHSQPFSFLFLSKVLSHVPFPSALDLFLIILHPSAGFGCERVYLNVQPPPPLLVSQPSLFVLRSPHLVSASWAMYYHQVAPCPPLETTSLKSSAVSVTQMKPAPRGRRRSIWPKHCFNPPETCRYQKFGRSGSTTSPAMCSSLAGSSSFTS